jgi:branched-chain amino acid transport system substrate-binding protein
VVSFDENGDIKDRTVSVFRYQYDDKHPEDAVHQYKYRGVALQTS